MTVRENVQVALISHGKQLFNLFGSAPNFDRGEAGRLLELVGMGGYADRPCGELAYGDLKRLELAVALANEPKLLLMDEPTAGMAPRERVDLMRLTAQIAREKSIGVLFTEHDMDVVFEHADRIIVLNRGTLIAEGSPAEVRGNPQVQAGLSRRGPALRCRAWSLRMKLTVQDLNSHYGPAHILFDIGFEVGEGEVVALLGRNGAGKSTTFRSIVGLVAQRSGPHHVRGQGCLGAPDA